MNILLRIHVYCWRDASAQTPYNHHEALDPVNCTNSLMPYGMIGTWSITKSQKY